MNAFKLMYRQKFGSSIANNVLSNSNHLQKMDNFSNDADCFANILASDFMIGYMYGVAKSN